MLSGAASTRTDVSQLLRSPPLRRRKERELEQSSGLAKRWRPQSAFLRQGVSASPVHALRTAQNECSPAENAAAEMPPSCAIPGIKMKIQPGCRQQLTGRPQVCC